MLKKKIRTLPIILVVLGGVLTFDFAAFGQKKKDSSGKEEYNQIESTDKFTEGVKYYILEDMAKALMLFQKSLEYDPDNDAAYYQIAKILSEKGEHGEALNYASKALSLSPQNKYYYLLNAEILTRQSNFKAASELYETMFREVEGTDEYLFDLAALYLYQDDYEQALETYERAEVMFGMVPEVVYQKQKIYLKLNKLDKAIAEGIELIGNFPGEQEYVVKLGEILVSNGKDKEAIPYLEDLLEITPEASEARLFLAKIYENTKQSSKAAANFKLAFTDENLSLSLKKDLVAKYITELREANGNINREKNTLVNELTQTLIEAHPYEANSHVLRGDYLITIDSARGARAAYLQALRINEDNFAVWQNVLNLEQQLNEPDSVIKHSEEALELYPNQAIIYFFNGNSHIINKSFEEAVYMLEQGKRMAASDPALLSYFNSQLGYAYNELEEYEKSDQAFEDALKANPNDDQTLNNYSYFLAIRQERLSDALKMSTKLVKNNPDNATFLDTHAWVLYMTGDYDQAKEFLERALSAKEGTQSGEIIEHYGDVLFKLGQVDEAVTQWKRAKGMNDASELIDKKIADRKLYE